LQKTPHETWRLSSQTSFEARKDFRAHHFAEIHHSEEITTQWYWITPFLFESPTLQYFHKFWQNPITIVKCSHNISLIFHVHLKSSLYQFMWNMFRFTSYRPQNSKNFKPFQQKIMFRSCFNNIIPCFNILSVPKKHVTIPVGKVMAFYTSICAYKSMNAYYKSNVIYIS